MIENIKELITFQNFVFVFVIALITFIFLSIEKYLFNSNSKTLKDDIKSSIPIEIRTLLLGKGYSEVQKTMISFLKILVEFYFEYAWKNRYKLKLDTDTDFKSYIYDQIVKYIDLKTLEIVFPLNEDGVKIFLKMIINDTVNELLEKRGA